MSLQVENLEHNMAKVTIEVEAAKLDDAIKQAFNKKKGQFNVPGFRKGKVPFQSQKNTELKSSMKMRQTS